MKKLIAILVTIAFLTACAGMAINPASLKTPHARGAFANNTYAAAYADHSRYASLDKLKPEAKELLNAKRKILIELKSPIGPLTIFNEYISTGNLISDSMFTALLDRLLLLETGWYTDESQAQVFQLTPQSVFKDPNATEESLDAVLRKTAEEASLISAGPSAQISEMLVGLLLELVKTGIHAIRAMIELRGLDEAQLAAKYQESLARVNSLDPNALKILE